MVNFIGVGAQKAGTSWLYACLYEHPEVCAPMKEIHFFSRPRYEKGIEWYEHHFRNCTKGTQRGEFSTSYLYSDVAAKRIKTHYPDTKLIAIVRNPVDRAYSQYRNAIKAGEIADTVSFADYVAGEPSVVAQGQYAAQLQHYLDYFPKEQLLVLIYEDIASDPAAFVREVYRFIGVDESFVPSTLHERVNVARTPKAVGPERAMHHIAETLRKVGLDKIVWLIKRSGLPELVRRVNTKSGTESEQVDQDWLRDYFRDDTVKLSELLGRDMVSEWNLEG